MQTVGRGFWSYAVERDKWGEKWIFVPLDEHKTEHPIHVTGSTEGEVKASAWVLAGILNDHKTSWRLVLE